MSSQACPLSSQACLQLYTHFCRQDCGCRGQKPSSTLSTSAFQRTLRMHPGFSFSPSAFQVLLQTSVLEAVILDGSYHEQYPEERCEGPPVSPFPQEGICQPVRHSPRCNPIPSETSGSTVNGVRFDGKRAQSLAGQWPKAHCKHNSRNHQRLTLRIDVSALPEPSPGKEKLRDNS